MRTIPHPTDFSPASLELFRLICPMARTQAAEIVVLHVVPLEHCSGKNGGDEVESTVPVLHDIQNRFAELRQLADGVRVSFQVRAGQPAPIIMAVAEHDRCDLIALTAPHHSPRHYQCRGSVAANVMRAARCFVLCLNPSPFAGSDQRMIGDPVESCTWKTQPVIANGIEPLCSLPRT